MLLDVFAGRGQGEEERESVLARTRGNREKKKIIVKL